MNSRIKQIRKKAGLTQIEFGEKIGVKGNTVTGYETGLRTPTNAVIKSICDAFNVNETWLRTGEGEMFVQITHKEKTVRFMADVAKKNGLDPDKEGLIARIIDFLADMSPEEWEVIASLAERWYQLEKEARDPEGTDEEGRD